MYNYASLFTVLCYEELFIYDQASINLASYPGSPPTKSLGAKLPSTTGSCVHEYKVTSLLNFPTVQAITQPIVQTIATVCKFLYSYTVQMKD